METLQGQQKFHLLEIQLIRKGFNQSEIPSDKSSDDKQFLDLRDS